MSDEWTRRDERGSLFMLHLIRWIALHLGRAVARPILYPISAYFLLFAPKVRRASYRYLQRIHGRPVHWWHVARHIHHFSATVLDRVFLLTGKHDELDIEVHNADIVLERVSAGASCILLGAHLGSFEVLRALAIRHPALRLKVLMQAEHNENITRILHALNPDIADTVIPLGRPDSLIKAYEFMQDGYLLGILGDRVVKGDKSVCCDFLGGAARFPTGPIQSAAALKAPVILFFGLYRSGRRYDIYFEHFADCVTIDRNNRMHDLQRWAQQYADRLAHYTHMSPYNWFNFYEFWGPDA